MAKYSKNKCIDESELDLLEVDDKSHINWYPGHMNKAIRKIKERLKMVDIVLEIRDARSPLITGNKAVITQINEKCRLIVINKANLADPAILDLWQQWFLKAGVPYVFVNCFDKNSLKKIVVSAKAALVKKHQASNPDYVLKNKLRMMIMGLPNTGKSTIINKLAKRNAAKVADKPGYTQSQLWVNIDKNLEILDTPGVMPPKIDKYEQGLWLACLHAIPDNIVPPELSAGYIISHLLKTKSSIFKEKYKLQSLDEDFITTLNQICKSRGCMRQVEKYDYDRVYKIILQDFRKGELGLISFGVPPSRLS